MISAELVAVIQRLKPFFNDRVLDILIWNENLNGSYTTKSGYQWLLRRRLGDDLCNGWNWVWKVKAPEKLKFIF